MKEIKLSEFQKVCHFIVFEGRKEAIPKGFYTDWGIHEKMTVSYHEATITQLQFSNTLNFFPKAGTETTYDIIVIEFPTINITAIGFPVKYFAAKMTNDLVGLYRLQEKRNFITVNFPELIQRMEERSDILHNDNQYSLGGVFLLLTGDMFLSTVRLIGKKPLESDIYTSYFKNELNSQVKKIGTEKVILKGAITSIDNATLQYRGTSSMHIDKFGNYKFYIQKQGQNLLSVIEIFNMLKDKNCLISRSQKPIILKEDDNSE